MGLRFGPGHASVSGGFPVNREPLSLRRGPSFDSQESWSGGSGQRLPESLRRTTGERMFHVERKCPVPESLHVAGYPWLEWANRYV